MRSDVRKAIEILRKGELVVYPTDTLYGLGADIFNEDAVRKVFEVKRRPLSNPLPIAVSGFKMLEEVAFVDDKAMRLARVFLHGKLTLLLRKKLPKSYCYQNLNLYYIFLNKQFEFQGLHFVLVVQYFFEVLHFFVVQFFRFL